MGEVYGGCTSRPLYLRCRSPRQSTAAGVIHIGGWDETVGVNRRSINTMLCTEREFAFFLVPAARVLFFVPVEQVNEILERYVPGSWTKPNPDAEQQQREPWILAKYTHKCAVRYSTAGVQKVHWCLTVPTSTGTTVQYSSSAMQKYSSAVLYVKQYKTQYSSVV